MATEIDRKFLAVTLPSTSGPTRGSALISATWRSPARSCCFDPSLHPHTHHQELWRPPRTEVNIDLTPDQFEALWPLTASRRLEKGRTRYPVSILTAEVGMFDGS
jgi:hypothetical protein